MWRFGGWPGACWPRRARPTPTRRLPLGGRELVNHLVFADPANQDAKSTLADVFERLAMGAECATWRNCYLTGADELRNGVKPTAIGASGMAAALSVPQLFDTMAIRLDGPRAWDLKVVIDWHFTDLDEHYRLRVQHGVLTYSPQVGQGAADAVFTLTKPQLLTLLAGGGMDGVTVEGDASVMTQVVGMLDAPDPNFAVVTP